MRCIFTKRTIGMMCFSIGPNRTIGTKGPSELPYAQKNHMENNVIPLMRCIFTSRTIGMTSFSIGTNRTIGYHWYQWTLGIALYPARPH